MTRYILNYPGGAKGDFLCNYINFSTLRLEENTLNKSKSHFSFFKKLVLKEYVFQFDEVQKILDTQCPPKIKILPCHRADKIPLEFLNKNDLKIVQLSYDINSLRSILIEGNIKYFARPIDLIDNNRIIYLNKNLEIDKSLYEKIKYSLDIELVLNGAKDINDDVRIKYYNNFFNKELDDLTVKFKVNPFPINPIIETINVDYHNLYVKKDFKTLEELFDIDSTELSNLIEKTWLSNQFKFCGKIWNLEDYGYRKFK